MIGTPRVMEWSSLDGKWKKRKIASNFAQHIEEELLTDQCGLEYRRERRCRLEELEVID